MCNNSLHIHIRAPRHSNLYNWVCKLGFQTCAISLRPLLQTKERETFSYNRSSYNPTLLKFQLDCTIIIIGKTTEYSTSYTNIAHSKVAKLLPEHWLAHLVIRLTINLTRYLNLASRIPASSTIVKIKGLHYFTRPFCE
jgi:hypothetical protein